jgi:Arc/MetJ family transcription regulator
VRTTIVIDDKLMQAAKKATGIETTRALVEGGNGGSSETPRR